MATCVDAQVIDLSSTLLRLLAAKDNVQRASQMAVVAVARKREMSTVLQPMAVK